MKLYTVDTLKNQNYEELEMVCANRSDICERERFSREIIDENYYNSRAIDEATEAMIMKAKKLEADAVIAVRYEMLSFDYSESKYLVLVYGTAIKFR